jgi:hypothetical protein
MQGWNRINTGPLPGAALVTAFVKGAVFCSMPNIAHER